MRTTWIINGAKLALSGAVIAAIGAWMLVSGGSTEVAGARADISTTVPVRHIVGHDFTQVVERTGMQPRPYEVNGNEVYFGVGFTDEEPEEVLASYQRRFVAAGINSREFNTIPDSKYERTAAQLLAALDGEGLESFEMDDYEKAYNEALLGGGVVPVTTRPGYVAMGGFVPKEKVQELEDVFGNWSPELNPEASLGGFMDGFRFIDAQKIGSKRTRVTSVWSRDKFDFKKMNDPNTKGVAHVTETPPCIGCTVGTQMKSLSSYEPFRMSNMYTSQSREDVRAFYGAAMTNRGWAAGDAAKAMQYVQRELGVLDDVDIMSFTKGGVESTIAVFPEPGGARNQVAVIESF